jgi:hypothetical protein
MKHLRKFEEYDLGHRFSTPEEEEITPLELNEPTGDETDIYSEEERDVEGDEYCAPCEDEDKDPSEEPTKTWGDENIYVERVVSFKQFEAKNNAKGKTPKNEKEKELAAKYPPKDKITKGDFIAAAIENKKGKKGDNKEEKEDKKDNKKEDDKKPKFGSKEWREKYAKKK